MLIIFLQYIRPFEAVDCAGFVELIKHTVQRQTSRHYTMFIYYFLCYLIKQYICITVYLSLIFIIR